MRLGKFIRFYNLETTFVEVVSDIGIDIYSGFLHDLPFYVTQLYVVAGSAEILKSGHLSIKVHEDKGVEK